MILSVAVVAWATVAFALVAAVRVGPCRHSDKIRNAFTALADLQLDVDSAESDLHSAREIAEDQLCGCGHANHFKIVGGSEALPNEFPWMVYLLIGKLNVTYMCGGFLVTDLHVITAAHCVAEHKDGYIRVVLGDHDRNSSMDAESVMIRSMTIVVHPRFNRPRRNDNDIAVVTLSRRAPPSYAIGLLCLPDVTTAQNYSGLVAVVAGWGKVGVEIEDLASDVLRRALVSIVDDAECRRAYGEISVPITDRMLCAGSPQEAADSCQGDSGGPLMVRDASGRYVAIGIASFGFGCASTVFPGVYTRLDRMLDFVIAQTTEESTTER